MTRPICCSRMLRRCLIDKVEQVVRLIRSKGVGVYFVTQNPGRHSRQGPGTARQPRPARAAGLHAAGAKGRQGCGRDFSGQSEDRCRNRESPNSASARFDLNARRKGVPAIVDRAFVVPPVGHIGPITPEQRQQLINNSLVAGVYETEIDRESAYEKLTAQEQAKQAAQAQTQTEQEAAKQAEAAGKSRTSGGPAPDTDLGINRKKRCPIGHKQHWPADRQQACSRRIGQLARR